MSSKVALVVLAAGAGSRFGGAKQCVKVNGVSLVRRAVVVGSEAGLDAHVVTGAHREQVRSELKGLRCAEVFNPDWEGGMGSSIAAAFHHLLGQGERYHAAVILLADQPAVSAQDLQSLVQAWQASPDKIWVADYGKAIGPPSLFPEADFGELSSLNSDHGARELLRRYPGRVEKVVLPQAAIDIDRLEDLQRFTSN